MDRGLQCGQPGADGEDTAGSAARALLPPPLWAALGPLHSAGVVISDRHQLVVPASSALPECFSSGLSKKPPPWAGRRQFHSSGISRWGELHLQRPPALTLASGAETRLLMELSENGPQCSHIFPGPRDALASALRGVPALLGTKDRERGLLKCPSRGLATRMNWVEPVAWNLAARSTWGPVSSLWLSGQGWVYHVTLPSSPSHSRLDRDGHKI